MISSLSGFIILQHLTALLLGEGIAHFSPRQLKPRSGLLSSFRRNGVLTFACGKNPLQPSCQRTRSRTADACSVPCKALRPVSPASIPTHSLSCQYPRARSLRCSRTENVVELLSTLQAALRKHIQQAAFLCTASLSLPAAPRWYDSIQAQRQLLLWKIQGALFGRVLEFFPIAWLSSRLGFTSFSVALQGTISNYFLGRKQILIATTKHHLTFKLSHAGAAVSRFLLKP